MQVWFQFDLNRWLQRKKHRDCRFQPEFFALWLKRQVNLLRYFYYLVLSRKERQWRASDGLFIILFWFDIKTVHCVHNNCCPGSMDSILRRNKLTKKDMKWTVLLCLRDTGVSCFVPDEKSRSTSPIVASVWVLQVGEFEPISRKRIQNTGGVPDELVPVRTSYSLSEVKAVTLTL